MSQLNDLKELIRKDNNAFGWLNHYIEQLNQTTPDFLDNCHHNIKFAKHVMYVANLILENNEAMLAEVCRLQNAEDNTTYAVTGKYLDTINEDMVVRERFSVVTASSPFLAKQKFINGYAGHQFFDIQAEEQEPVFN